MNAAFGDALEVRLAHRHVHHVPAVVAGHPFDIAGKPEAWCADFVKWVWATVGLDVEYLTAAAGSFGEYGPVMKTPQVGDAALYNYDGQGYADHVTLVVAVNTANETYTRIGGAGFVAREDAAHERAVYRSAMPGLELR